MSFKSVVSKFLIWLVSGQTKPTTFFLKKIVHSGQTAIPVHLCIVSSNFCGTTAELKNWERNNNGQQNLKYLIFSPSPKVFVELFSKIILH